MNPYPFSYSFVDQDLSNLYQNEHQLGNLFNVFAILAIFISCLGLYGLSAFVAEQRTKEIGIRKALGASPSNIVMLLSGRFLVPIFIVILVASPLAFYLMNKWLQSFADHIDSVSFDQRRSAGKLRLKCNFPHMAQIEHTQIHAEQICEDQRVF